MHASHSRLALLFDRYYAGSATDAEIDELMQLIRLSDEDETLSGLIRNAWEHVHPGAKEFTGEESEQMLRQILQHTDDKHTYEEDIRSPRPLWWLPYAAASMLIAGIFAWYLTAGPELGTPKVATRRVQVSDIPPGGNKAVLALANGARIVLDSLRNGKLGARGEFVKKEDEKLAVAATATFKHADSGPNTLFTPKGGQYQIVLQDGTRVWLNASSSIRFPTVFPEKNRTVEITGEAYFEVVKDKKRPFRVRFAGTEVEVLGTSFNIMAYRDEHASKTTLVEGSVRLKTGQKATKLRPGQQGSVLPGGQITTLNVDVSREIAWKDGIFYFRNAGIDEIMRQAARWYNVEVTYQGKMQRREFTGKVSRHVNISELLNMLRYAGVDCKIQDNKVIVRM